MPPLNISIQLSSLRLPLRRALVAAAQAGAKAVEIDARHQLRPQELSATGLRELQVVLDDLNLRVSAIAFPTRGGYDTLEGLDRRVAATKEALSMASRLRAEFVVNRLGRVPAEPQGPAWETLTRVLSDLGDFGQRIGARLAAQTGSESGADLARLMAAMPAHSLGVDFDPAGLLIGGFSPSEAIVDLARYVVQFRARDAVRDFARRQTSEVPLGRGAVDLPELLGALEEYAFRGYVVVAREQPAETAGEIAAAVQFLKSL
ncbi:MAG TPA: sugar phosphate isomerase/epimerase family protein [Pirellulales bacterium]|nr:sugar phosphate isomerase/epimerase family protein [Pirellulales bacterium]